MYLDTVTYLDTLFECYRDNNYLHVSVEVSG